MSRSPEERLKTRYGGYDWKKEYPHICDTDLLKKWIKENRMNDTSVANVISHAIECTYTKGMFIGSKGLFTLWETKKLAVNLDMDFWTFYKIFLSDIYEIEWDDVSFLKRKQEETSDS